MRWDAFGSLRSSQQGPTFGYALKLRMRRPYRQHGKPFAIRTLELISALQLIADSLTEIRRGEIRYLMVLSGQLRSLVAERSKGEVPLLLDVAANLGRELAIYCMPGVDDPAFPEELREDLLLYVAGFPVTLERQFEAQRRMDLSGFLDESLILFHGTKYTTRTIIEWFANKAGGSHYSSNLPEDFAALMTINMANTQPLVSLLLQIGDAVLAAGRKLLKSVVDFEVHALIFVPKQKPGAVQNVNYLFDAQYEGSSMRISLVLNSRLMPVFYVSGLQGVSANVECDRLVDWEELRLIHASVVMEDNLSTTIELSIDGKRVGRTNIEVPLFILADPLDYDTYHNRAVDGGTQEFSFAVGQVLMVGRELGPEERANLLLYISEKRANADSRMLSYGPRAYAHVKKGTKNLVIFGSASLQRAGDLAQSGTPSSLEG